MLFPQKKIVNYDDKEIFMKEKEQNLKDSISSKNFEVKRGMAFEQ